MVRVLAHHEARPRLVPALKKRAGAAMAVSDPKLPRPGPVQQGNRQCAFALMRVLARHHVGHKAAVRVVDNHRLPRQGRAPVPAQHAQALFARRQVVAVDHARRKARKARAGAHPCHHGRKPLGAALHQAAQDVGLSVVDLVVERGQRHRQAVHLPRRRVQGRTQPQHHQGHQLHHRREQQLARTLPLPVRLEHGVNPAGRKRVLQGRSGHHARRRALLEPRQNNRPN